MPPLNGHADICPCCTLYGPPFTQHGKMLLCRKCGGWHSEERGCAPRSVFLKTPIVYIEEVHDGV